MTDLAGQPDGAPAVPPPAAVSAADIEAVKTAMRAEIDQRVAGLQRVIASKDREIKNLTLAGLPEDEREQVLTSERDAEIEQLKLANERLSLAGEYGTEMPFYERLLAANSAQEQLTVMREYAKTTAAPPTPPPAQSDELVVPDVNPNNPPQGIPEGIRLDDGTLMTDQIAETMLKSIPRLSTAYRR